eukprot:CAMPEP_0194771482 /NCGR_PEP_ID=MMETSP0323_2-20130528/49372_1 /TAXON_ID=2866 ORGANISM="Crypthecodinium cohnii, Strain Seligo" /NCGR_SAMPLE_ID=MMETSP0323_2 /ASSEMBLY_ACC=CAM_ASM_000346 /LENGTH=121 /DNA_ID=CAMNT_0039705601 /DNA_START=125 /DNA_END=490 /DNA_ORIENTATION=-
MRAGGLKSSSAPREESPRHTRSSFVVEDGVAQITAHSRRLTVEPARPIAAMMDATHGLLPVLDRPSSASAKIEPSGPTTTAEPGVSGFAKVAALERTVVLKLRKAESRGGTSPISAAQSQG